MKKLFGVALLCLLSACSQGLNGTYGDQLGITRYAFQSNGEVTVEAMGVSQKMSYERDGQSLKVQLPQGNAQLNFTIKEDGSLEGPMGIVLEKVEE
ncbi:hypothetical protein [Stenotrophomonas pictorum]|jgi:hypothetical protein|uniref:hypothetical protein n=1 Tax=Stenotrophomonas pictorum TaxID=86184 RepID=UPI000AEEDF85|nr:hypothetical protein [Stenotrophomonas pictorum]